MTILRIVASLCLVIAVQVFSGLGRRATLIEARETTDTSYDFVIVGGGIAGLTVAESLTENPTGTHAFRSLKMQRLRNPCSQGTCHQVWHSRSA